MGPCAPVRARLGLNPGQRGTKKLLASQYGDHLVCAARCDEQYRKRFRTMELIGEESNWEPRARHRSGNRSSVCGWTGTS